MDVRVEIQTNGVAVIALDGRLDLLSAVTVKERLGKEVLAGNMRLVVDLGAVTFIDSSGLGALIGGLKAARQAGGDLRIARPTNQALVVLKLTSLDRVLRPFVSVEEAVAGY